MWFSLVSFILSEEQAIIFLLSQQREQQEKKDYNSYLLDALVTGTVVEKEA